MIRSRTSVVTGSVLSIASSLHNTIPVPAIPCRAGASRACDAGRCEQLPAARAAARIDDEHVEGAQAAGAEDEQHALGALEGDPAAAEQGGLGVLDRRGGRPEAARAAAGISEARRVADADGRERL